VHNFPLVQRLSDDFGEPAFLDNDGNAAALGEWMFGAARGHHDVLYITVSTGIGAGVISEDRLVRGFHGIATELGHVIIDPDGPPCNCGFRGHVESFSSGPAIVRFVLEEIARGTTSTLKPHADLTPREIADAARNGDALAIEAFRRAGEYLELQWRIPHAFDHPSLSSAAASIRGLLFDAFHASLKERDFHPIYLEGLKIEMAAQGDDAGLLGALALAQISAHL
jgi:glucokinase